MYETESGGIFRVESYVNSDAGFIVSGNVIFPIPLHNMVAAKIVSLVAEYVNKISPKSEGE